VKAVIASGVACRLVSPILVAVTVTSSRPPSAANAQGAAMASAMTPVSRDFSNAELVISRPPIVFRSGSGRGAASPLIFYIGAIVDDVNLIVDTSADVRCCTLFGVL
jgi:hypothetical protein